VGKSYAVVLIRNQAYTQWQLKQRSRDEFVGALPMHLDDSAGQAFKGFWKFLTSDTVTSSREHRSFFDLGVFVGKHLRALMLLRPAAAVNNGVPAEEDWQQRRSYDAEFYTMNAARLGGNLRLVKSPQPTMKTCLKVSVCLRYVFMVGCGLFPMRRLFGFEEFRSGLAAEPTNTIPSQRVSIHFQDALAIGSHATRYTFSSKSSAINSTKTPAMTFVIRGWNTAI